MFRIAHLKIIQDQEEGEKIEILDIKNHFSFDSHSEAILHIEQNRIIYQEVKNKGFCYDYRPLLIQG